MKISAKMATKQDESRKTPKNGPSNQFISKRAQDFKLLKQVPESSHQISFFGRNQYIGTLILSLSAFPHSVDPKPPEEGFYSDTF